MLFREIPNLAKFEQFARRHVENDLVMDCYRRVRDLIEPVPSPSMVIGAGGCPPEIGDLKATCEAVEQSTRLLWACAAAIGQVEPPLWPYLPDYFSAIDYFARLTPLILMDLTKAHRIKWESKVETDLGV